MKYCIIKGTKYPNLKRSLMSVGGITTEDNPFKEIFDDIEDVQKGLAEKTKWYSSNKKGFKMLERTKSYVRFEFIEDEETIECELMIFVNII